MPGQEGIPAVYSPMARTLGDLIYFSKSFISMKPWNYDHSVHPIEWRKDQEDASKEKKVFRVGVLRTDGEYLCDQSHSICSVQKVSSIQLQHALVR